MKKVALILLIFIYSLATMGFSLKQFYCCGKLTSVSVAFIGDTNKKCGKGDEKTGCCDNEYKFFKVKDKHITAEQVNNPVKHFVDLHLYTPSFQNITFASQKITIANKSNAPPLHPKVPAYIYNCVFTI